mmetsp:Transcript_13456/g.13651  ORF Transcript_13456/g.13651 Transcript_13456/m.13651 type:complete len:89 (-) Transcript_13456:156-422(-)
MDRRRIFRLLHPLPPTIGPLPPKTFAMDVPNPATTTTRNELSLEAQIRCGRFHRLETAALDFPRAAVFRNDRTVPTDCAVVSEALPSG